MDTLKPTSTRRDRRRVVGVAEDDNGVRCMFWGHVGGALDKNVLVEYVGDTSVEIEIAMCRWSPSVAYRSGKRPQSVREVSR